MAKFLRTSGRAGVRRYVDAAAKVLIRAGVSANAVTVTGTAVVVAASVLLLARGALLAGLIVVGLSVLTDMLDGAIARVKGTISRFGALLDSTCDRLADGAIFAGLAYWLLTEDRGLGCALALWVLIASQLVSYVKARAEGLGAECNVGIAERPERLIIAALAVLVEILGVPWSLEAGLGLLAVLASITVVQRLLHARNVLAAGEERVDV
ncbi:CDP-alcohol phosphatidyltransferase family protein [Glycomyces sp. TRM65418]|uniref:phosphatidylinositol phosphate synthase n=1 Tax=Glycomyces sp. TRM65418 TaxID=2867006 RepID=UPI001CE58A86|nr:CDP-alcohol phosphatidyltransferase family protein [Glycomyces sp. TRM65418]MCC3761696.1 CDP-alcohol phosphatidyltransferase family protein [Glycomyces sp. TRM65418]QZD55788.1 CDP-alcohol phosphatidyltransferase family protein [Glycomyces sp. TRM65418]